MFPDEASHGSPRVSECQSDWTASAAAVLRDWTRIPFRYFLNRKERKGAQSFAKATESWDAGAFSGFSKLRHLNHSFSVRLARATRLRRWF